MLSREATDTNFIDWFDPTITRSMIYHPQGLLSITPPVQFKIKDDCHFRVLFLWEF
jgi:hypothetical protein